MGWRFRKSKKIAPGVRLNIGKRGASVSFGHRGARLTVGRRGTRVAVGIPGTGISYSAKLGGKKQAGRSRQPSSEQDITYVAVVSHKRGFLTQFLWFIFIGWWLGAIAVLLAYLCFAFIITIPIGVKIINRIPYLMALRESPMIVSPLGTVEIRQRNIIIRALWFIFVGIWLSLFWMIIAYTLCLTIIGTPLGFWMFDKAPAILTLRKST